MLCLNNLTYKIDNQILFQTDKLEIPQGTITVISGESGSGKTTLLSIIGLVEKANVEYTFNNQLIDYDDDKELAKLRKNKIGFLFQDATLLDTLSVKENIKFYFNINNQKYDKRKTVEILNSVKLNEKILRKKIKNLSLGEKQRLAIACLFIKDPDIIICDEPTSALDNNSREVIINLLKQIAHEQNKTIIIASHDDQVIQVADVHYHIENERIKLIYNNMKNNIQNSGEINSQKKDTYSSFFNYIWGSINNSFVYNILIVLVLSIGMSLILYYFSLDSFFYSKEKTSMQFRDDQTLLVLNKGKFMELIDNNVNEFFSNSDLNKINDITSISKVEPFTKFLSNGLSYENGWKFNNDYKIESYIKDEKVSEIQYDVTNKTYFKIYPTYEHQNFDQYCDELNKNVEGIYITQRLASLLNISDLKQASVNINSCKIPVANVESIDPDTNEINYSTVTKCIDILVPIRGIISSKYDGYYLYQGGNIEDIYMDHNLMNKILEENKTSIEEIKASHNELYPNSEFTVLEYQIGQVICILNEKTDMATVRTEVENLNSNYVTYSLYLDSVNQIESITEVKNEHLLQATAIIGIELAVTFIIIFIKFNHQQKEYCILKCNGYSNKEIKLIVLLEALLISIVAIIIANIHNAIRLLKSPYIQIFNISIFNFNNFIISAILVFSIIICSSLLSVKKVCKMTPMSFIRKTK